MKLWCNELILFPCITKKRKVKYVWYFWYRLKMKWTSMKSGNSIKKLSIWQFSINDNFSIVNQIRLSWNFLHIAPKQNWRESIKNRTSFGIFYCLLWPIFQLWPKCDIHNPANCAPLCAPLWPIFFFWWTSLNHLVTPSMLKQGSTLHKHVDAYSEFSKRLGSRFAAVGSITNLS